MWVVKDGEGSYLVAHTSFRAVFGGFEEALVFCDRDMATDALCFASAGHTLPLRVVRVRIQEVPEDE